MRVVTVAGDPEREAALAGQLGLRREVEVVLRCVDRVEALAALRGGSLDAAILVGDPIWFDAQCAHEATLSSTRLVGLAPDRAAAERVRAWGGVGLSLDASIDELLAACRAELPVRPDEVATEERSGRTIVVWGPKGAPGRSSIAFELASALAASDPQTLLVDADTYGGDLLQMAGVVDDLATIVWATRLAAKGELVPSVLLADLKRVSPDGPVLLPGIPRADLWPEISQFGFEQLVTTCVSVFSWVVVDVGFALEPDPSPYPEGGEGRNRTARAALRDADRVIAVVRADPVGMKSFLWAYEHLRELVDPERISIVANRVRPGEGRQIADLIKRYVGRRPAALVPDDPDAFSEAVAAGRSVRSLPSGGSVSRALGEVAASLGGRVRPHGFLSRLGGRA